MSLNLFQDGVHDFVLQAELLDILLMTCPERTACPRPSLVVRRTTRP